MKKYIKYVIVLMALPIGLAFSYNQDVSAQSTCENDKCVVEWTMIPFGYNQRCRHQEDSGDNCSFFAPGMCYSIYCSATQPVESP